MLRNGPQNPVNENGPDSDEDKCGAGDKTNIIPSLYVVPGGRLVVGKLKERRGVGVEGRVEVMDGQ